VEAKVRLRQHTAVVRTLPYMTGISLANALLLVFTASAQIPQTLQLVWLTAVIALSLAQLQFWFNQRRRPALTVSSRRLHTYDLQASLAGAVWGAVPLTLAFDTQPTHQLAIGLVMVMMLGAGTFTLLSLPRAMYAYAGTLSTGMVLSGLSWGTSAQILGLVQWALLIGLAIGAVRGVRRNLIARVSAEVKAEHQNQLIGLLLRDFEEQGSDLLWEIDSAGRLQHVSKQFASALGMGVEDLNQHSLLALLGDLQKKLGESDRESASTLHERLTQGHPFRDVLLPMVVQGKQRWWSMTAKPLVDERGSAIGWRGVARDVTQARIADRRLAWLAHYDTLTGLTNRAHFRVLLEGALQNSRTRLSQGAVMCLDLDGFKNVNDTLGHATGDALLVEVSRRLKEAVGRSNVVARLGGDEFAVLLRSVREEAEIGTTAQRIVDAMRPPCEVMGAAVPVRVSIGIARFPQDGTTVDEMMQNGDLALYDAKAHAPGSMRFFVARLGEQIRRRLVLERDLREAMEKNQLQLHYQPKVSLDGWEVIGFEALLRWNHPEHGAITPNEFIPVAEDSGLILPMGEWALTEACCQAARWPDPLQVAVNISPVQVMAQNLPEAVQRALKTSGLAPGRLELEITESVFINDNRGTVERLHALRRLGVQIALDDFGTGYSSLAYLRRFPFDTLKIDRAFVRELLISRDARSIVRNILALAKSLRMSTVAEGVEEPLQVNVLEAEGCNMVQGYFASRPMPADQVLEFVLKWRERARPQRPRELELEDTRTADLMPSLPETML
jgi:diguanylate cyclase (GGDEF)-like protein/PAS domain S-box-containing protein